ncbi:MAG TPA: hypothetical protein VF334_17960 [Polyangia bacterium]
MRALVCVVLTLGGCVLTNDARYCDAARSCGDPAFPHCDEVKHECEAGGVPDGGAGDDAGTGDDGGNDLAVVRCIDSSSCPSGVPICAPSGECVECTSNNDCFAKPLTPFCGPANTCVACLTSANCAPKVCDLSANVCRACQAHADCASGVCDFGSGNCVDPTQIYLVDNGAMTFAACNAARPTQNGTTPATAFCDISEAFAAQRPYILVAGHGAAFPYGPFLVTAPEIYVGPGANAAMPAVVKGAAPATNLVKMSNIASVTLDGFELDGANTLDGIDCTSTKSAAPHDVLIVENSYIHNTSGTAAIHPVGCDLVVAHSRISTASIRGINDTDSAFITTSTLTDSQFDAASADALDFGGILTMDRCRVIDNSGGSGNGLVLNNPTFTVTNSFFYNNDQAIEFNLTGTAASVFMFNTVAFNTRGFACGQNTIQASIYVHNGDGPLTNGTGAGTCKTLDVVTDGTGPQPIFVDTSSPTSYDLRLAVDTPAHASANQACCIDQVKGPLDGGTAPLPLHDFFDRARPLGVGWDVGAHEAQ